MANLEMETKGQSELDGDREIC